MDEFFTSEMSDSNILPVFTNQPELFLSDGVKIVVGPGHWLEEITEATGDLVVKESIQWKGHRSDPIVSTRKPYHVCSILISNGMLL